MRSLQSVARLTCLLAALLLPGAATADFVLQNTAANRARGVAGCTQTSSGIVCPGAPGGGGGGFGGAAGVNMMMGLMNNFMAGVERGIQEAQARRAAYARQLNGQGIQLYNEGNYQGAFGAFSQALQNAPGDATIRANLNEARQALAREQEERERQHSAEMEASRQRVAGMIGDLQESFGGDSSSTLSAGTPDMDFAQPQGTSFFGLGGGKPAAPPPPSKPGDLAFVQSSDELFGKGGKGSAPPDILGKGSDVPAFKLPPKRAEGELAFIPPDKDAPPPVSRKAMILLDALEDGNGDWEASRALLEAQRKANPKDRDVLAAIKDFNAAYQSAMEDARKAKALPTVDPRGLKDAVAKATPPPPAPAKKESPPTSFDPGGWFPDGPPKPMAPRTAAGDTKPEVKEAQDLANEAFVRYGKGDYEGAMQDIVKAINLTPDDKWLTEAAKYVKSSSIIGKGEVPLRPVTDLERAHARRFAALGAKEMSDGDYDKAFGHFISAGDLDPNNRDYDRAHGQALLGHILKGRQSLTGRPYEASGSTLFDPHESDSAGLLESVAAPVPSLSQQLKSLIEK